MRPRLSVLHVPRDVLAVMSLMAAVAFGSRAFLVLDFNQLNPYNPATTNLPLQILSFVSSIVLLGLVLPVGALIDRIGSHRLFAVGGALAAAGAAVSATASVDPLLFTGRFMATSGFTVTGAAAVAYVVRRTPEHRRGWTLGIAGAATTFGSLLAQAATEATGTAGWRVGLLLTTLTVLAGLALAQRYASPIVPSYAPEFRLRHLLYTPNRLILVILAAIAVAVLFNWGWASLLRVGPASGAGPDLTGLPSFARQLLLVPVAVAAGVLSDRVGRLRVLVPSVLFAGVASVLAFQTGDASMYAVFTLALSLGSSAHLMIQLMVVDRAAPSRLGAALATYDFTRIIGLMLATPLLGPLLNAPSVILAAIVLPAAAILAAMLAIAAGESRSTHPPRTSNTRNAA